MNDKIIGVIILIFFVMNGCLTDSNDVLKFSKGIFSEDKSIDESYHRGMVKVLNQLNEKSIDEEEGTIFRLSVFPSYSNNYVIGLKLNDADSLIQLTYKRLEFNANLDPEIDIHLAKKINKFEYPEAYSQLYSLLDKADFWQLNNKWNCDGADGVVYVLEGVKDGRYHLICRWSPEACKFEKWNEFSLLVNYIIGLKSIK